MKERENMMKMWKKALAFVLAAVMTFSAVNVPVHAQKSTIAVESAAGETIIEETVSGNGAEGTITDGVNDNEWDYVTVEDIYESENYNVTFTLQSYWDSGYNAIIKIENTGDSILHNWCLVFDYSDNITNIWNAEVISNTESELTVKNVGWNQDIAVGGSIEFGISSDNAFRGFPNSYRLRGTKQVVDTNDYLVEYQEIDNWEDGVTGSISILNTSDHVLEDWILEFDFDEEIVDIWNGEIETHNENHYVIRNSGYNGNIATEGYITFGIRASRNKENSAPQNYSLYTYNVCEGDESGEEEPDKDKPGEEEPDKEKPDEGESDEEPSDYEKERLTDTDGDGLSDFLEKQLGTDKTMIDTDGDGLSDYLELVSLILEPTLSDTNGNGLDDGNEDSDGDGLINLEEAALGCSITRADTDGDGLTDGEEINIYFTNPLVSDTDNDGLPDGEEILINLNPAKADTDEDGVSDGNELIPQRMETAIQNSEKQEVTGVTVNLDCAGYIDNNVSISDVYGIDVYSSDVIGLIGVPVDIQCETQFTNATISFCYNKEALGDTREEDLRILWYDETNNNYVLLEDSIVDTEKRTVSYTTDHFSTYMVVDRKKWKDVWETKINYEWEKIEKDISYDIAICLDYSVSEEELAKEKLFAKNIIEQMQPGDRVKLGIYLPNTWNTYSQVSWTKNKSLALSALDSLEQTIYNQLSTTLTPSGTYRSESYQAIEMLVDMTDKSSQNSKVGFLVNAGKNEDVERIWVVTTKQQAEEYLKTLSYPVRSVSVTEKINQELDELLKKYDGNSYDCDSLKGIERQYGYDLPGIDDVDTDGDGILDVYEINGIRLSNGQIIYTNPEDYDTDGDGLSDYEELGGLELAEITYHNGERYSCEICRMNSNPLLEDTDNDGIGDEEEICLGLNPKSADTDGDRLADGIEVQYGFDPFHADPDYDGKDDFEEFTAGTDPYMYDKDWYEYLGEFIDGFILGDFIEDTDSLPTIIGQILSSMIPLVDIRDVVGNIKNGDYLFAGLSGVGLVPVAGDAAKTVGKIGKFTVKNIDDVPKIAGLLEFLNKNFPDVVKVLNKSDDFVEAASQISKLDNIKFTRKQAKAITEAFENAGLSHYLIKTSNSLDLKDTVNIGSEVWGQSAIKRGKDIDEFINGHLLGAGLGQNFPVADRLLKDEKILVSTKSLDIAAQSYQNPDRLKNVLSKYANSLKNIEKNYFNDGVLEWGETTLRVSQYDKKALEIVLPDVIISKDALKVLNDFKTSMEKEGMEVWYRIA